MRWRELGLVAVTAVMLAGCPVVGGFAGALAEVGRVLLLFGSSLAVALEIVLLGLTCSRKSARGRVAWGLVTAILGGAHWVGLARPLLRLDFLTGFELGLFLSIPLGFSCSIVGVAAVVLSRVDSKRYVRILLIVLAVALLGGGVGAGLHAVASDPRAQIPTSPVREAQTFRGAGCALHEDGRVSCWGAGSAAWPAVVEGVEAAQTLRIDPAGGCGVDASGRLLCWDRTPSSRRAAAFEVAAGISELGDVEVEPRPDGTVERWRISALDGGGQLVVIERGVRRRVGAELPKMVAVSSRGDSGCGVHRGGGAVTCWRLPTPGAVVDWVRSGEPMSTLAAATSIVVTRSNGCVLHDDGTVACWPLSTVGEPVPTAVEGLPSVQQIVGGTSHVCALGDRGTVHCWGGNGLGQLGVGDRTGRDAPKRVEISDPVPVLSARGDETCARTEPGEVWCWGRVEGSMTEQPEREQTCSRSRLLGDTRCVPTPTRLRWFGPNAAP